MKKYYHCKNRENLIGYYGISQDPKTKEYILVTQFANNLDLRTFVLTKYSNNINSLTWNEKINILKSIAELIKSLHSEKSLQGEKLFHGNLHPGNLLKNINYGMSVLEESILLDLVSCWIPPTILSSVQQQHNNYYLLYGVLPYIAPEILRGDKKSQACDIYNFGMIMWELSTLSLPYCDRAHNLDLAIEICEGVRPDPLPTTPEFYFDLMERCWDDDPSLRPNATEIIRILDMNQLYLKYSEQTMKVVEHQEYSTTKNRLTKLTKQVIKNTSFINSVGVGSLRDVMRKKFHFKKENFYKDIHPEAHYTSRIFDFSFNRLSVSSNSNNSFMAGNTSTSEDFGEGQSSLAISETGFDDVIEVFAADLPKDSKGKKKA
ncbi:kinase-like domain-containing protein [Glomus cerebriforme]|uniref:Kinase-like domain-containing protein n=1 Tax=Glomus cerebriforme TaxID=658196 RepID=A0A397SWP7_9GLOM|nr:kinase-like domain-containing protein [Glomus cerebriforme]